MVTVTPAVVSEALDGLDCSLSQDLTKEIVTVANTCTAACAMSITATLGIHLQAGQEEIALDKDISGTNSVRRLLQSTTRSMIEPLTEDESVSLLEKVLFDVFRGHWLITKGIANEIKQGVLIGTKHTQNTSGSHTDSAKTQCATDISDNILGTLAMVVSKYCIQNLHAAATDPIALQELPQYVPAAVRWALAVWHGKQVEGHGKQSSWFILHSLAVITEVETEHVSRLIHHLPINHQASAWAVSAVQPGDEVTSTTVTWKQSDEGVNIGSDMSIKDAQKHHVSEEWSGYLSVPVWREVRAEFVEELSLDVRTALSAAETKCRVLFSETNGVSSGSWHERQVDTGEPYVEDVGLVAMTTVAMTTVEQAAGSLIGTVASRQELVGNDAELERRVMMCIMAALESGRHFPEEAARLYASEPRAGPSYIGCMPIELKIQPLDATPGSKSPGLDLKQDPPKTERCCSPISDLDHIPISWH